MSLERRLEQLEAKSQQRRAAVEAVKESQISAVLDRLGDEDRNALRDSFSAREERPAWFKEVMQATRAVCVPLEGGEAARAWLEQLESLPEGTPYPSPPPEAPAYFEAEV